MKQFNLEEWLKDKSRKVTTRLGNREVRIICWDRKNNDNRPIITLMIDPNGNEYITYHTKNGFVDDKEKYTDKRDLFFADEEESINEFETRIYNLINFSDPYNYPSIKEVKEKAKILLDLARKELKPELDKKLKEVYNQGGLDTQEEITKCLPKWKKATEHIDMGRHVAIIEDDRVILSDYVEEGEYYIVLDDLKTLPKEE